MNAQSAISIARETLEKRGFEIVEEPDYVKLVPADEINKWLTAIQVSGPGWSITFPLKHPNFARSEAGIYVDDATGKTIGGGLR